MSTKCIVLGEDTSIQPAKKPIEFVKQIDAVIGTEGIVPNTRRAAAFDYIELVCPHRVWAKEYDIMFAYNANHREEGILYLGHWNDGVVE